MQSRLLAAGTKHIQRRYCRYFVTAYTEGKMTPTGTTPLPCTIEHHVQSLKIMQARQHSSLVMNLTGYSLGAGGCSESNAPCAQMLRTWQQGAASLCCDLQSDRVKLPEYGKLNPKYHVRRWRAPCGGCAAGALCAQRPGRHFPHSTAQRFSGSPCGACCGRHQPAQIWGLPVQQCHAAIWAHEGQGAQQMHFMPKASLAIMLVLLRREGGTGWA